MANICVFCGSSEVNSIYSRVATKLGEEIGKRKHSLVYGGSNLGLMGKVARAVQISKGKVLGILPKVFEKVAEGEDELIIAEDLRHRKFLMEKKSDAFIALPGGIGVLDEIADVLQCKQLKFHSKPLVIINTNDFFNNLLNHLDKIIQEDFAHKDNHLLYHVVKTPKEALNFIENTIPN